MNKKPRLAIITTHPIQYNAPLFKLLVERSSIEIKVFYTWSQAKLSVYDPGFNHQRTWDIPLLTGYDLCFVENIAKEPGSHHFKGIINPSLIKEVETWLPDAVLVFGWSFQSHLACMRHFKGKIPVFFRGDSTLLDEEGGPKTWLRRISLRWGYRFVDKAFYTGRNNRAYFEAHGLKGGRLKFAPHAVDNKRFQECGNEEAGRAVRASLGFTATDFLILFAGKFEEKKNPFYLIDLAAAIKDPQVKFVLLGNGPLENRLKEKARFDTRIKFLPFRNQSAMPALYAAADCFILPSTGPGETWGLAANEAMACGLPVLLSEKVGGAVDLIAGNGIVFHPAQVEPVRAYIEGLKNNPDLMAKAKQRSLSQIQNFRLEHFAAALEAEMSTLPQLSSVEKRASKKQPAV